MRQKRIRAIVLAGKKLAQLEFLQFVNQAVVFCRNFLLCVRAVGRVALFRSELLQRVKILDLAFQFLRMD